MRTAAGFIRLFAIAVAVALVLSTAFDLIDHLNLVARPPDLPDTANLVERRLASAPYGQAIWPVFLATHLFGAIGFLGLAGLAVAFAERLPRGDARRVVLPWSLLAGGLLGALAELVYIGSGKAFIASYCDCGFKEQEIISQTWAVMVTQTAADWVLNGAIVLTAIAVIASRSLFEGTARGSTWSLLSMLLAVLIVATLANDLLELNFDVGLYLGWILTGIGVPLWAAWLGLRSEELPSAARAG